MFLFHRLHRIAAGTDARALTDGVAVALRATGTGVFAYRGKSLLLAVDLQHSRSLHHLHHLGFDQVLAACTFPGFSGNGFTGTTVTASAGVDFIAWRQFNGAMLQSGIDGQREKDGGNDGQQRNSNSFFHSLFSIFRLVRWLNMPDVRDAPSIKMICMEKRKEQDEKRDGLHG